MNGESDNPQAPKLGGEDLAEYRKRMEVIAPCHGHPFEAITICGNCQQLWVEAFEAMREALRLAEALDNIIRTNFVPVEEHNALASRAGHARRAALALAD